MSAADIREQAAWLAANRAGIEIDIASAHSARRHAASEWMREDDCDFRADLRAAFDKLEAALSSPPPSTKGRES